jgi:hypothetical protein
MPLRLDNAKGVAHMPTARAAKNKSFEPRFKIDHAASPMPETKQPERLAPRATSNRNGGRDHLGILGEIKSEYPGEIIGIGSARSTAAKMCFSGANFTPQNTLETPLALHPCGGAPDEIAKWAVREFGPN